MPNGNQPRWNTPRLITKRGRPLASFSLAAPTDAPDWVLLPDGRRRAVSVSDEDTAIGAAHGVVESPNQPHELGLADPACAPASRRGGRTMVTSPTASAAAVQEAAALGLTEEIVAELAAAASYGGTTRRAATAARRFGRTAAVARGSADDDDDTLLEFGKPPRPGDDASVAVPALEPDLADVHFVSRGERLCRERERRYLAEGFAAATAAASAAAAARATAPPVVIHAASVSPARGACIEQPPMDRERAHLAPALQRSTANRVRLIDDSDGGVSLRSLSPVSRDGSPDLPPGGNIRGVDIGATEDGAISRGSRGGSSSPWDGATGGALTVAGKTGEATSFDASSLLRGREPAPYFRVPRSRVSAGAVTLRAGTPPCPLCALINASSAGSGAAATRRHPTSPVFSEEDAAAAVAAVTAELNTARSARAADDRCRQWPSTGAAAQQPMDDTGDASYDALGGSRGDEMGPRRVDYFCYCPACNERQMRLFRSSDFPQQAVVAAAAALLRYGRAMEQAAEFGRSLDAAGRRVGPSALDDLPQVASPVSPSAWGLSQEDHEAFFLSSDDDLRSPADGDDAYTLLQAERRREFEAARACRRDQKVARQRAIFRRLCMAALAGDFPNLLASGSTSSGTGRRGGLLQLPGAAFEDADGTDAAPTTVPVSVVGGNARGNGDGGLREPSRIEVLDDDDVALGSVAEGASVGSFSTAPPYSATAPTAAPSRMSSDAAGVGATAFASPAAPSATGSAYSGVSPGRTPLGQPFNATPPAPGVEPFLRRRRLESGDVDATFNGRASPPPSSAGAFALADGAGAAARPRGPQRRTAADVWEETDEIVRRRADS